MIQSFLSYGGTYISAINFYIHRFLSDNGDNNNNNNNKVNTGIQNGENEANRWVLRDSSLVLDDSIRVNRICKCS